MFCDDCINAEVHPEKSSFVKGCTYFKKDAIISHLYGNPHLYLTNKFLHEQNPKDAPAERAKLSLNKSVSEKLMILFYTIHAVNIKARPLRDYEFITEMDALKGLELPADRYKLVHSCKDFTQAIADVERQKISDQFDKSSFVAIVDGSIDSAIVDNEIEVIQTCTAGEIHTDFLRCCQVQCGNAEGNLNAIKRATASKPYHMRQILSETSSFGLRWC